ncbi:hypothetical protein ACFX10_034569 [Malus domestica]
MPLPRQRHIKGNPPQPPLISKLGVEARSNQMKRPRPSKWQRCLPLPYLILFQVNKNINLKAKGKISILTSLILVKGVRNTTAITKGIAMIIPNPRQLTQWVKHASGQPLPRGMRHTHL